MFSFASRDNIARQYRARWDVGCLISQITQEAELQTQKQRDFRENPENKVFGIRDCKCTTK